MLFRFWSALAQFWIKLAGPGSARNIGGLSNKPLQKQDQMSSYAAVAEPEEDEPPAPKRMKAHQSRHKRNFAEKNKQRHVTGYFGHDEILCNSATQLHI